MGAYPLAEDEFIFVVEGKDSHTDADSVVGHFGIGCWLLSKIE